MTASTGWSFGLEELTILQERRQAAQSFLSSLSIPSLTDDRTGLYTAAEYATNTSMKVHQQSVLDSIGSQSLGQTQIPHTKSSDSFLMDGGIRSSSIIMNKNTAMVNLSNIQVISGRTMNLLRKSNSGLLSMVDELGHSRIQFATEAGSFISSTISVIPYVDPSKKKRHHSLDRPKVRVDLFALQANLASAAPYNPTFLDDPDLKIGRHKTIITLPCFMGSIIQYSKPADIKKELNEHFREIHSNLDPTLTLSQIRNLKDRLINVAVSQDLEFSSVAMSFVYFEKLVLKNFVAKVNRRVVGGICLFLACKINDPKDLNLGKLLSALERELDVDRNEILEHEYSVYSALDFHLFVPLWEMRPHLDRILKSRNVDLADYLGFSLGGAVVL